MGVEISEDEADEYSDLYEIQGWCIDLLAGMKRMRQGREDWRDVTLESAKEIAANLPGIIEKLENGQIP